MSKNVLITGGTSGIGRATALLMVQQGLNVVTCGRDSRRLSEVNQLLNDRANQQAQRSSVAKPIAKAFPCDLSQTDHCQQLFEQARETLGSVDILINNAAVAPLGDFSTTTAEQFESVINTNLRAAWVITQLAWRAMEAQGSGAIVNISSMAAIDPFTGFSLYGASKGWTETWTKALADEGQAKGIRVYAVRPGAVETPMLRSLFPQYPPQECVSPESIADTIFKLAVDQSHPTGSIVTVTAS